MTHFCATNRLFANYVTCVRRYVAPGVLLQLSPEDLAGKPITWTIGGPSVNALPCKHFPQVSGPNAAVTA